jgi:hypothetical protein
MTTEGLSISTENLLINRENANSVYRVSVDLYVN